MRRSVRFPAIPPHFYEVLSEHVSSSKCGYQIVELALVTVDAAVRRPVMPVRAVADREPLGNSAKRGIFARFSIYRSLP